MSWSFQLPTELLHEIAGYLSKTELLSFCRASKLFSSIATAVLYREITALRHDEIPLCCQTLRTNTSAARSVRYLKIEPPSAPHIVLSALIHLHEITKLDLSLPPKLPDSLFASLGHTSFPNLRDLALHMDLTSSVLMFLRRNSLHIRNLCFQSLSRENVVFNPLCTFPELESYSGTYLFIPAFLPGSPVKFITTRIHVVADADPVLSALSKTTTPLENILLEIGEWHFHYLESLSRYVPRVLDIEFVYDIRADSDAVALINTILPKFKCLRRLDMSYFFAFKVGLDVSQLRHDYEVLQFRGQICPSLISCRLPTQGVEWILYDGNWIPNREDGYTWRRLQYLPARDLQRLTWLQSYVKRLCGSSGLHNPFEDVRSVDTGDTSSVSIANEDDEDSDSSDESLPGRDSSDTDFLRRVRLSLRKL